MSEHPDDTHGHVSAAIPLGIDCEPDTAEDPELAFWWEFWSEHDKLRLEVEHWERASTPTALDIAAKEVGLSAARAALAEHEERGSLRPGGCIGSTPTSAPAATPISGASADDEVAAFFDPVTVEALETMFPASGQWKRWAERAKENGLIGARTGWARFNPHMAGIWFLSRRLPGWDQARVFRVLANNLPARSQDKRAILLLSAE